MDNIIYILSFSLWAYLCQASGYVEPSVDSSHTLRSWLIALCVLLLLSAISGTLLLLLHLYWKEQGKSFHLPTIFKINEKSPEPERLEEGEGNSGSLYMSLHPHSEDVYHILDGSSSNAKTNVKTKPVIIKEKTEGVNEKTPVKLTKSPGTPEKKQRGAEKSNLKQVKRPGFQEKTPKETEKHPIKLVTSGIQEKSHGVTETSPIKKTKSDGTPEKKQRGAEKSNLKQVKLPGFLEKTPRETEKHPIKLIPRGEVTDNSVYENLPS
ncbi:muscle M-line assembly protein unc-89 isoform X2 [Bombina bombina]|uniref:muscle M-line assembly protein unc-89 isoform X2 n=1 Tax=Bombina bombina TaxID=8345 RepID=UPI00235B06F9|nr:muscle M-line assembly protein unc-89 isoform X2 [Bombina bombina]